MNNIEKTILYLQKAFEDSEYFKDKIEEKRYRIEHTYRVASIAREVALKDGLDVEGAVIGALLHDLSYIEEMSTSEDRKNHGRRSAFLAKDFVESLDMDAKIKEEVLYGIAIHVDDEAGYEGNRTLLAELIGEADNIDRFDYYRLYEWLLYADLNTLDVKGQIEVIEKRIEGLKKIKKYVFKNPTSDAMWQERLDRQISFFSGFLEQLNRSNPDLLI